MQEETKKRYAIIRKQLDQLGYKQKLELESLPLVERLMSDFMRASEVTSSHPRVFKISRDNWKSSKSRVERNNLLLSLSEEKWKK